MDTWLTSMQVAALAVAGMCHALLGSIKVPLAKKLNIDELKVPSTLYEYGNTASASIPLTLGLNKDKLQNGNILLCGFGVGFSVASALLHIDNNVCFNCEKV